MASLSRRPEAKMLDLVGAGGDLLCLFSLKKNETGVIPIHKIATKVFGNLDREEN